MTEINDVKEGLIKEFWDSEGKELKDHIDNTVATFLIRKVKETFEEEIANELIKKL